MRVWVTFWALLIPVQHVVGLRLVTTSPQVTELVFQLGKGEEIVAVTEPADYPAQAKRLPKVGSFLMPNLERIFLLRPELIVVDVAGSALFFQSVQRLNIPLYFYRARTLSDLFVGAENLFQRLEPGGNSLALEKYRRCYKDLQALTPIRRFRFLTFVWLSPPMLSSGNYLTDLIELVGGEPIGPKFKEQPYPEVSEEWLRFQTVDVVYLLQKGSETEKESAPLFQKWWPHSPPKKVIKLDPDDFGRASFTPLENVRRLIADPDFSLPESCSAL